MLFLHRSHAPALIVQTPAYPPMPRMASCVRRCSLDSGTNSFFIPGKPSLDLIEIHQTRFEARLAVFEYIEVFNILSACIGSDGIKPRYLS